MKSYTAAAWRRLHRLQEKVSRGCSLLTAHFTNLSLESWAGEVITEAILAKPEGSLGTAPSQQL